MSNTPEPVSASTDITSRPEAGMTTMVTRWSDASTSSRWRLAVGRNLS